MGKWSIILSLKLASMPHSCPHMPGHCDVITPLYRVRENTLRFTACVFECGDRSGVPLQSGGGMEAEQMRGHAPFLEIIGDLVEGEEIGIYASPPPHTHTQKDRRMGKKNKGINKKTRV